MADVKCTRKSECAQKNIHGTGLLKIGLFRHPTDLPNEPREPTELKHFDWQICHLNSWWPRWWCYSYLAMGMHGDFLILGKEWLVSH